MRSTILPFSIAIASLPLVHCAQEVEVDDDTELTEAQLFATMPSMQKIRRLSEFGETGELLSEETAEVAPGKLLPIYRGSFPRREDLSHLHARGVKTVISLAGATGNERRLRDAYLGLRFSIRWFRDFFHGDISSNPFEDEPDNMLKAGYEKGSFFDLPFVTSGVDTSAPVNTKTLDEILSKMSDPKFQPVYVHCVYGADRTSLVVALYRLKVQKWLPEKIFSEMKAHDYGCKNYGAMNAILDSYLKKAYAETCNFIRGCDKRYDVKTPTDCRR